MAHLLHLDSSARRSSFSREVGARFAATWRAADPAGEYTYRDLTVEPVPPIGEAWTDICDHLLEHGITAIDRYPEAVTTPAPVGRPGPWSSRCWPNWSARTSS